MGIVVVIVIIIVDNSNSYSGSGGEEERKRKMEKVEDLGTKLVRMRTDDVSEGLLRMRSEGVTLLEWALLRKVSKEEILWWWKLKKLCVVSHGITFDFSEVRCFVCLFVCSFVWL